jgi:hypothetical protein
MKTYWLRIDDKVDVTDSTISYEKLVELKKKVNNISSCQDVETEYYYKIGKNFYILVEASHECIKDLLENGLFSETDVLTDLDFDDKEYQIFQFVDENDKNESGMCIIS